MRQPEARSAFRASCRGIAAGAPEPSAALHETVLDATPAQGPARLVGRVLHPGRLSAAMLADLAVRRVAHGLREASRHPLAFAVKASAAPLCADVHPAARIGRRISEEGS